MGQWLHLSPHLEGREKWGLGPGSGGYWGQAVAMGWLLWALAAGCEGPVAVWAGHRGSMSEQTVG